MAYLTLCSRSGSMLGMVPTSSLAAGRLMPAAMNMPSSSLLVSRDSSAFTMVSGTPPALASLSSNLGSCMCSASQRSCPIQMVRVLSISSANFIVLNGIPDP